MRQDGHGLLERPCRRQAPPTIWHAQTGFHPNELPKHVLERPLVPLECMQPLQPALQWYVQLESVLLGLSPARLRRGQNRAA